MSPTGEHPAISATGEHAIGSSTPIRTGLVISLLGLAALVGAAHYRLQSVDQRQTEQAASYAEHLKEEAKAKEQGGEQRLADQLRLQRIEDTSERTARTVERMERKVDALTEGGVVRARGQIR